MAYQSLSASNLRPWIHRQVSVVAKYKKRALFVGRFQPFHLGHHAVVKKLLGEFDEVLVVLGSAEEPISFENPFTAGERAEMIRSCFSQEELCRLILIPVRDINNDEIWVAHLMSYTPKFDVVISNNDLVKKLFGEVSIPVMRIAFIDRGQYEGRKIREMMLHGGEWKRLVPEPVAGFIDACEGCARLRKIRGRLPDA